MSACQHNRSLFADRWFFLCAAIVLATLGCGKGDDKGQVNGTVTLDGTPLASGSVRFVAASGQSPTAGATITDGHFTAAVPTGATRVEFSAPKVVGKKKMYDDAQAPQVDVVEERLPARYNDKSELTMDVQAGAQERQFDLTSK